MTAADPLDQLRRLAELRDTGVITGDEFAVKKADLLALVGSSPSHHRDPVSQLLGGAIEAPGVSAPFRGINADRVHQLQSVALAAESEIRRLDAALRSQEQGKILLAKKQRVTEFVLRFRRDRVLVGPAGMTAIVTVLSAAASTVMVSVISLDPSRLIWASFIGMAFGLALSVVLLFVPSDSVLVRRRDSTAQRVNDMIVRVRQYSEQRAIAVSHLRDANAVYQQALAVFQSREYQLFNCGWRLFKGTEFERFLQAVFECRGYSVTATGRSGDQGADLVVEKNGCRTVIQAKGYAGNVSNAAVQQAFTAMAFYRCQRCAVITNSDFTASAMEVAERTGCLLVDQCMIPKLILGEIGV